MNTPAVAVENANKQRKLTITCLQQLTSGLIVIHDHFSGLAEWSQASSDEYGQSYPCQDSVQRIHGVAQQMSSISRV